MANSTHPIGQKVSYILAPYPGRGALDDGQEYDRFVGTVIGQNTNLSVEIQVDKVFDIFNQDIGIPFTRKIETVPMIFLQFEK